MNSDETVIRFHLNIPADRLHAYYSGQARDVLVRSFDGKRIRFPASVLREFVDHDGVSGTFQITCDARNRFRSIRKI